ncbi:hypothetical protein [Pricia sp.]|uniref:hypothetical protein n=1 Tax=Pricia sp. TaxID=2268138 RepID=UPI003594374F
MGYFPCRSISVIDGTMGKWMCRKEVWKNFLLLPAVPRRAAKTEAFDFSSYGGVFPTSAGNKVIDG